MIAKDLLVGTVWLRNNRRGFSVLEYSSKQLVSAGQYVPALKKNSR